MASFQIIIFSTILLCLLGCDGSNIATDAKHNGSSSKTDRENHLQKSNFQNDLQSHAQKNSQKSSPAFSFLDLKQQANGIPKKIDPGQIKLILAKYFDIPQNSPVGTLAFGRINYRNNFLSESERNVNGLQFKLSKGAELFTVEMVRDSYGRVFGQLQLQKELPQGLDSHPITIQLLKGEELLESCQSEVQIVETPLAKRQLNKVKDFVLHNSRLSQRYKLKTSTAQKYLKDIRAHQGRFSDLSKIYGLKTEAQRTQAFPNRKEYGQALAKASERIAGLTLHQYNHSQKTISSSSGKEKLPLYLDILKAIEQYIQYFPVEDLYKTKSLAHNDITHQWRFGDPLAGASILILHELGEELYANPDHQKIFDAMNHFHLMTSFMTTDKYRSPDKQRYFLQGKEQLRFSSGLWADANRHHRMRTWICQSALLMDYNQPLSYFKPWYFPYGEWGRQHTTLLPGWEPQGSLADLKFWADSNACFTFNIHGSGFKPDGTISHHTGERQDMAHLAYGFEWQTEGILDPFKILRHTPFSISPKPLQVSMAFLSKVYPIMMFKGSMDFQTVGRSHQSKNLTSFYQDVYRPAAEKLIKASESMTSTDRSTMNELKEVLRNLDQDKELHTGNHAFWVNDYMVQRRGGEQPSFMSVKMQSARTKGAEGFKGSSEFGFHNGSGVFQIKVDGKEYSDARYSMDWHLLPGTTEEWRDDSIPLSSKHKAYSKEAFAGTASDGQRGLASFVYSRSDPYSTAGGYKSYFLHDDHAYFLGSNIHRTKKGQGKEILTTVEQVEWDGNLHCSIQGQRTTFTAREAFQSRVKLDQPAWFHHDDIAYFIYPSQGSLELIAQSVQLNNRSPKETVPNLLIAISHGSNPKAASYRYAIVPYTPLNKMEELMDTIGKRTFHNQGLIHAYAYDEILQASFQRAATLELGPWKLKLDQPSIVQCDFSTAEPIITVSDPTHDLQRKSVELQINRFLPTGDYAYLTQGLEVASVPCQKAKVIQGEQGSIIQIQLPDSDDTEHYAFRESLYAGMPATLRLKP
jgi:hypothetical protein